MCVCVCVIAKPADQITQQLANTVAPESYYSDGYIYHGASLFLNR